MYFGKLFLTVLGAALCFQTIETVQRFKLYYIASYFKQLVLLRTLRNFATKTVHFADDEPIL